MKMAQVASEEISKGANSSGIIFEAVMLKKNKEPISVEIHGKVIFGENGLPIALQGVTRDVTKRKRAEEALRGSEEKYRTLFEESFDGLFITSPGGKILEMNKKGVAMFGYDTKEEILSLVLERDVYAHPPDRKRILAMVNAQGSADYEVVVKKKNGEEMITYCALTAVKDERGVITSYRGIIRDITERKKVEESLKETSAFLNTLLNAIPVPLFYKDTDGRYIGVNKPFEEFFGKTHQELVGKSVFDISPRDLAEFYHAKDLELFHSPGAQVYDSQVKDTHGAVHDVVFHKSTFSDPQGHVLGLIGVVLDITERKRAEEALETVSGYNRSLIEASLDPLVTISGEGKITDVNKATEWVTGYSRDELIGTDFADYFADPPKAREGYQRAFTEGMVKDYELQIRHRDGDLTAVMYNASVYHDRSGEIVGLFAAARDITERKISEELIHIRLNLLEFAASHPLDELLQKTLDEIGALTSSPIGFYHFVESDQKTLSLQAWSTRTVKEFCKAKGKGQHYSIDRAGVWVDCIRERKPIIHNDYPSLPHRKGMPEGHAAVIRELVVPIIKSGQIVAVLGIGNKPINYTEKDIEVVSYFADVAWEIATRKRAQEALKESEQQYRTLFEESIDGVYSVLRDGTITDANTAFCELFGYTTEEMIGKDIRELYFDPADRPRFQKEIEKKGFVKDYEVKFRKRDGTEVDCLLSSSVHFGKDGSIAGYRGIVRDLTARKGLQRQLLQAQKMEAIGTLAGGIAHDFNNILQVVLGFSEMILMDKEKGDPEYNDLEKVLSAGKKGADLVQRLLMFSRKTEINPKPLNLNHQIQRVESILKRTFPKIVKIDLILADGLSAITADPTQIEQILMNLSINARDALPEGGRLIIETSNVTLDKGYCNTHLGAKPGDYVVLAVSDTGEGMDKDTLEHIFEPFFSTKPAGKGTGLGLAMVYGIVKQHDGYITCYSEIGVGTAFKLYFPVTEMKPEASVRHEERRLPGGSETILLVDDEELIRDLAKRILSRAGYTVLTAANGREALQTYKKKGQTVSLIVLDLIMPEMDGKQCLRELLKINPGARVLLASGYSANGPTKEALEGGAKGFVSKPFDMGQLLQTVRKILDAE